MAKAIILPKRNRIFSEGREYIEGEREYNEKEKEINEEGMDRKKTRFIH
jgi:hypothetical protein